MKLKKYGIILVILLALTVTAFVFPALAATDDVIYVKDGGTGNGSSPDTAMGNLFDAINALPTGGGTVVVCGDMVISPAADTVYKVSENKTGKVTVTGQYRGTDYNPTISFKNKKVIFDCCSEIEFKHLTCNWLSGSAMEFFAGPHLTIGDGMEFYFKGNEIKAGDQNMNGVFCVRLGNTAGVKTSVFDIKSGTISWISGGNGSNTVDNATIRVHPNATVVDFVQAAGTRKEVGTANITIDSANVPYIYLGGYSDANGSSKIGNVTLNVSNTSIKALYGERGGKTYFQMPGDKAGTCTGNLTLNLDNVSIENWNIANLNVSGEQNLTVKNATDLKINNDLSGWDSLTLENSTVWVDTAYAGPPTFTADAKSGLIVDDATVSVPVGADLESKAVIYLDGSLTTSGTGTADSPVCSMADAYKKLESNGVKVGIVIITKDTEMSYATKNQWPRFSTPANTIPVTITSQDGAALILKNSASSAVQLHFRDVTKFSNLHINQQGSNAVELWVSSELTFGEGITCSINDVRTPLESVAVDTYPSGRLVVRIGDISTAGVSGKFFMHSGALTHLHGGNNALAVNNAEIYVGKGATIVEFIQAGGTRGKSSKATAVTSSTITLDHANVHALYLGGYSASSSSISEVGNVIVKVKNTDLAYLYGERGNTLSVALGTVKGDVDNLELTLENSAVQTLDLSMLSVNANGKAALTLKDYDYLAFTDADIAWWKSLSLDNATIHMSGVAYTTPATVTADADSVILVDKAVYSELPTITGVQVAYFQDEATNTPESTEGTTEGSGEGDDPVGTLTEVWVDQTNGLETNDGTSATAAVATLEQAYALLKPNTAATVYIVGEYKITQPNATGSSKRFLFPEHSAKVTICGTDSTACINFAIGDKTLVQFVTPTELKNLSWRYDHIGGNMDVYAGPELTVGENVTFICGAHSQMGENCICIRGGYLSAGYKSTHCNHNNTTISVYSGTLSYVMGGNGVADIAGTATINFGGTAKVTTRLQSGGVNGKDVQGKVTINISGGEVCGTGDGSGLVLIGHGSNSNTCSIIGDLEVNISGGSVSQIVTNRTEYENLEGNLTLNISGTAKIASISLNPAYMTTDKAQTIVFNNCTDVVLGSGFGLGWDSITFKQNAVATMTGAYAVGESAQLNMEDGSILYLNSEINTAAPAFNPVGTEKTGKVVMKAMHNLTYVAAKAPGIHAAGNNAYYKCSSCDKFYADAEGTTELDYDTEIYLAPTGNAPTHHNYTDGNSFSLETIFSSGSSQGIAVYGDLLFKATNTGTCSVWDLTTGQQIGASFDFGSVSRDANGAAYHSGATANHSNSIMFGYQKFDEDDPFPLLYVCAGNDGSHIAKSTGLDGTDLWGEDTEGSYYGHLAIERIFYDETTGKFSAETVQRVFFNDVANIPVVEGDNREASMLSTMRNSTTGAFYYTSGNGYDAAKGYQKIGWGWPAWLVDSDPTSETYGKLYLYSARYRTKSTYEAPIRTFYNLGSDWTYFSPDGSAHIITEVNMPALPTSEDDPNYGKNVILYPKDITNQFSTAYNTGFTQGGTLYQGRIYYSYGSHGSTNPHDRNYINVFDIAKKKIVAEVPLCNNPITKGHEPECPAIWNGELIISMNTGVYSLGYIALDEPSVKEPTCTEGGKTYVECALCGHDLKTLSTTEANGHDLTETKASGATCTEGGNSAYWTCETCGKHFSDADGENEIAADSWKIPADGHDLTKVDRVEPTKTEDGNIEHWACGSCNKFYADAEGTQEITESETILTASPDSGDRTMLVPAALIAVMSLLGAALLVTKKRFF